MSDNLFSELGDVGNELVSKLGSGWDKVMNDGKYSHSTCVDMMNKAGQDSALCPTQINNTFMNCMVYKENGTLTATTKRCIESVQNMKTLCENQNGGKTNTPNQLKSCMTQFESDGALRAMDIGYGKNICTVVYEVGKDNTVQAILGGDTCRDLKPACKHFGVGKNLSPMIECATAIYNRSFI